MPLSIPSPVILDWEKSTPAQSCGMMEASILIGMIERKIAKIVNPTNEPARLTECLLQRCVHSNQEKKVLAQCSR